MGGFGSGRGISRRKAWRCKKLYITNLLKLDISELMRLHKQNPDCSFVLNDFKLRFFESKVIVESPSKPELQSMLITVASFPCNFGGFRYFAFCPACQSRVRALYFHKTLFACRHCLKTVYPTQNETLSYRLQMKTEQVKGKLNNDVWTKPKWMRQKTFKKLREEYFNVEDMRDLAELFSVRTLNVAERLLKMYGTAIAVPVEIVLTHYGKNWEHNEYDSDVLWTNLESQSKGKITKEKFKNY